MRRFRPFAATVLLALAGAAALAQTEPAPTATLPAELPPARQKTVVEGQVPDLRGRWLVLANLDIPNQLKTVAQFWEGRRGAEGLEVEVRFAALPPVQQAALDAANAAKRPWEPSAEDAATIATGWDALKAQQAKVAEITTTLVGRDAFDATIKNEPKVKDALWVVKQDQTFDASAAPTVRQHAVYGVLAAKGAGYTGAYATTIIAAAPFPIPISFQGTFELRRLDGGAGGGILARLAALFSGCGR